MIISTSGTDEDDNDWKWTYIKDVLSYSTSRIKWYNMINACDKRKRSGKESTENWLKCSTL